MKGFTMPTSRFTLEQILNTHRIDPVVMTEALQDTIRHLLVMHKSLAETHSEKLTRNRQCIQALESDLYDKTNVDIIAIRQHIDNIERDVRGLYKHFNKESMWTKVKRLYYNYIYPYTPKGIYNRGLSEGIRQANQDPYKDQ